MESQPQNPEFGNNHEYFQPCMLIYFVKDFQIEYDKYRSFFSFCF